MTRKLTPPGGTTENQPFRARYCIPQVLRTVAGRSGSDSGPNAVPLPQGFFDILTIVI